MGLTALPRRLAGLRGKQGGEGRKGEWRERGRVQGWEENGVGGEGYPLKIKPGYPYA